MNSESLVSIITPAYNSSKFILDTIYSVKNQTYQNWEMLIVNDVSTDNTVEIVKREQEKDNRIKLISLDVNGGAARARNIGINNAKGKYIAFLDSDDLWAPDKLKKQVSFMEENKYDFTFTSYSHIDKNGHSKNRKIEAVNKIAYNNLLKRQGTIGTLTVVINREKIKDIKMPDVKTGEDFALWLSILRKGYCAYGLPKTLAYYRILPNSISANKLKAAKRVWRVYRDFEQIKFIPALYYFINYIIYGIKKTYL